MYNNCKRWIWYPSKNGSLWLVAQPTDNVLKTFFGEYYGYRQSFTICCGFIVLVTVIPHPNATISFIFTITILSLEITIIATNFVAFEAISTNKHYVTTLGHNIPCIYFGSFYSNFNSQSKIKVTHTKADHRLQHRYVKIDFIWLSAYS